MNANGTSTDIAVRAAPAIPLPDKISYAQALAKSGLLPKQYQQQPANLLYAIEYGEALGLPAITAITGVHVIEGKPSASAGLISALVRRAGHKLRVTGDDTSATARIVRRDDLDFTFEATWTLDRAKTAGLAGKEVWKKFPAAMLKARAITEVARDACEEALNGLHYTAEELGAVDVDENGAAWNANLAPAPPTGVVGGEVVESEEVGESEPVDWQQLATQVRDLDALRALWAQAKEADALTDELQAALKARAAKLEPNTGQDVATPAGEPEQDGERVALWQRVLAANPENTTSETQQAFAKYADGETFDSADIALCREYAAEITGQAVTS